MAAAIASAMPRCSDSGPGCAPGVSIERQDGKVQSLGELKGAHRLPIPLRVRHAEAATNVALGVASPSAFPPPQCVVHQCAQCPQRSRRHHRRVDRRAAQQSQRSSASRNSAVRGRLGTSRARARDSTPPPLQGAARVLVQGVGRAGSPRSGRRDSPRCVAASKQLAPRRCRSSCPHPAQRRSPRHQSVQRLEC